MGSDGKHQDFKGEIADADGGGGLDKARGGGESQEERRGLADRERESKGHGFAAAAGGKTDREEQEQPGPAGEGLGDAVEGSGERILATAEAEVGFEDGARENLAGDFAIAASGEHVDVVGDEGLGEAADDAGGGGDGGELVSADEFLAIGGAGSTRERCVLDLIGVVERLFAGRQFIGGDAEGQLGLGAVDFHLPAAEADHVGG